MSKVALLVGVSGCEMRLPPLRGPRMNLEAIKGALQGTHSGFEVQALNDAPLSEMMETIERGLRRLREDDQVLVLFSGYGILDTDDQLYLVSPTTAMDGDRLLRSRTLPASFLLNLLDSCPASRQVVIFDCCFRRTKPIPFDQPEHLLEETFDKMIGDRRVILTANTYTQHEKEPDSLNTWSYTRYLAEGAATGAADIDCDGALTVKELHHYAYRKLRMAAPNQHPQFYGSETASNQIMLQVPSQTPAVQYRQFLEKLAVNGEIDTTEFRLLSGRNTLNELRDHLGISPQKAAAIENEVLRPVREHQQRIHLYRELVSRLNQKQGDQK